MKRTREPFQSAANAMLLSIHPGYVRQILVGAKRVEFRRRWPDQLTGVAAIYSTSPQKAIVALVEIDEVVRRRKTELWGLAKSLGGGVTRSALFDYMHGLDFGVALKLGRRATFDMPLDPKRVFGASFRPPQSFRYLRAAEISVLSAVLGRQTWA